ncbi:MAG: ATP-dependent helicase/deoxyribonuclease subunit [Verrucomicrobiota bacterium]
MQARFLLGPAGSGKTFRCVAEVRAELLRTPDGPPLIFLAPKQATFQIERQLLAYESEPLTRPSATLSPSDGERDGVRGAPLAGYTRLQILSFERLAAFVFAQLGRPLPESLSEEGRIMVLRALLAKHHQDLKIFRASARLTGFAGQLSSLLRELQRSRVTPRRLIELCARVKHASRLDDKLQDLSRLLGAYEEWLASRRAHGHSLEDTNRLPDLAAEALRQTTANGQSLRFGALWLDGFAEMTPQEIELLAALAPHCESMTLAFCLASVPDADPSWISPWAIVGRTFGRCREALRTLPTSVEVLPRSLEQGRFAEAPALAALECALAGSACSTQADPSADGSASTIRLVSCPNAEAEATFAAREILHHAQAGGRFRDCAVLVRSLTGYQDILRRVFSRYDIPFFLDDRQPVTHHPVAELTRYALRTVVYDWRHEDWFGALKTGLVGVTDEAVDALENEALRFGWQGKVWREPLTLSPEDLERVRQIVVPPFEELGRRLWSDGDSLTGAQMAEALRELWAVLKVEAQLEQWAERAKELGIDRTTHDTVWAQLNDWLANVELAFDDEALPLRDWLPILEAGLAELSAGAVPPSLDQVLVGSIDRSRNPDLQRVFVLGVNEGVFPEPPAPGPLLSEVDRLELEAHGVTLSANQRLQLGHERYFGYIAFTRARRGLAVTWSRADADGGELNPSPFVAAIQRALPELKVETFSEAAWGEAVHARELEVPILTTKLAATQLGGNEDFAPLIERWQQAQSVMSATQLSAPVAAALYGKELRTSVSALEQFLGCPFHYISARALRAEEREEFEPDIRQKGSFQHEVMELFHRRIQDSKRTWRELTPAEARLLVRSIGAELIPTFGNGLFNADDTARFTAMALLENLERLVETLIGWAPQYAFDPARVEVSFGLPEAELPAWRLELANGRKLVLRGRIDRVDLCRTPEGEALLVICDYKSSGKKMDAVKMANGLEIQLLAYLAALTQMPEAGVLFGVDRLTPAGVFYIPLRGKVGSAGTRSEAAAATADFQHLGRFDGVRLQQFDGSGAAKGEQFKYSIKKDGSFGARGNEALPPGEFPKLLTQIEAKLRETGESIFSGEADVSPYRLKREIACDRCAYRSVCRFDPWTMPFRNLKEEGK